MTSGMLTPQEIAEMNRKVIEENLKRSKARKRSVWHPQYGWLTQREYEKLNQNHVIVGPTVDERARGYKLTEQKFKEICEQISRERKDGTAA